jgi:hypothetical protein
MGNIFNKHEAFKPALVQKIRNFKITIDPRKMLKIREMEPMSAS